MTLLFFRGHGPVAVAVRLLTWRWWERQKWASVPAHIALFFPRENGWQEIEAVVTGIRSSHLATLPTEGVVARNDAKDEGGKGWHYAAQTVGRRYGFEAAAITGIASLCRTLAARLWASLESGRTAPLHCSLLAANTLQAAGYQMPRYHIPPSPNELKLYMETNQ